MLKIALIVVVVVVVVVGLAAIVIGPTTLKRWAYEEPGRDRWQQPEKVVESLGIALGQVIADVGSGGGYFTFRFARAVGPEGTVYAVDLDEGLNAYVEEKAQELGLGNMRVLLGAPDDARLPQPVDLIFTCNTAHHLEDRIAYFAGAQKYLRPGGRVAIIDYYKKHGSAPPEVLRADLERAGYRLEESFDFLPKQYFMVFSASGS